MTTETLVEIQSRLNSNGVPLLGDCVLHLNDGNDKVIFTNGRSSVPARLADVLARRDDVVVLQAYQAPVEEPVLAPPLAPQPEPAQEQELAPNAEQPPAAAPADPADVSPEVRAAMEHLAAEGLDVPVVQAAAEPAPVTVPDGFEAATPDGQPRCLAAKADGSQCANAARGDSHACQMPAHIAKLTAA